MWFPNNKEVKPMSAKHKAAQHEKHGHNITADDITLFICQAWAEHVTFSVSIYMQSFAHITSTNIDVFHIKQVIV